LDRLTQTSKELSKDTGQICIAAQADVRHPQALQDAVAKTIETFGRIDFVICGKLHSRRTSRSSFVSNLGAAGNFLAPISGLSENAFKTVMEIDTVGCDHISKPGSF